MKKLKALSKEETEYQKFFRKKLDEYDVKSPSQLDEKEKKKFFNEVEIEWKKEKSKG